MAIFKKAAVLSISLINFFTSGCQKLFFEQLTTAEGLPSDYVNCLFEDSKGNLWIGTDKGACRYDGRQFQYFSNDNGLPSNFVSCFEEDPNGNLWIGTVNAGACIFDGKKLQPFSIHGNEKANILEIKFNSDGSFFIVSEKNGLSFYQNIEAIPRLFKNFSFLKELEENKFLTGVSEQLYILEKKGSELNLLPQPYPAEKGNLFAWLSDHNFIVMGDSTIQSYAVEGKAWIVKNEFVVRQLTDWRDFKNVFVDNNDVNAKDGKLSWRDIKKIVIRNKELFMATSGGLVYIDADNKQHHFTDENGLGTNFLKTISTDRQNNIYLCTYGGGVKIWPAGYLAELKLNGKVTSLYPSDSETLITTTKSVYLYRNLEKKISEIKLNSAGNYTAVYKRNGEIFLGTLNNFYKLPAERLINTSATENVNRYSYYANSGTSGFAMHKNYVLISTYGDGIYIFNDSIIDTLTANTVPGTPYIIESLVPLGNSVAALTYNAGLVIYDSVYRQLILSRQQGLLSNTVLSVFKENENTIWIGTKNGLNLFDGKKIIKTYSEKDGLIGTNVLCIFKDALDRLWVLSDRYLHLVDDNKLRAIRSHPLLFDKSISINRAAFDRKNNMLFIGLTNALLTVDINKVVLDTVINIPRLSAVQKDTTLVDLNKGEVLSFSNPFSSIIFRFAGLNRSFTRQSDLYYKLKGFDNEWKFLSGSNEIVYQKLVAGQYELLAKTINPDGYASSEIRLLTFEVLPPLWKRDWFIVAMSIVLLSIFFYVGSILSKRRYKRKLQYLQEEYRMQLERERIARELHDNVGSQLTYLINKIDDDYPMLAEKKEAEKLSGFARGAMQELRETIWALDKKEVHWDDLENKIRQLIRLYKNEKHTVELVWEIDSHQLPALNPLEALNIYRVIQEALNNAEKYSGAGLVNVLVKNHFIEITDNGKGFDLQHSYKGYGLKNMKKRAEEMNGKLQIESRPGHGTSIKLILS